ncbi:MAG: hypothetical protein A2Z14_07465 [Chloroflexi bacterium RBG_16_48_8]|nr:MAG: hypothetical protein A2Z14_07465 [Chloroflexi bacterium RBG_16_48_8]
MSEVSRYTFSVIDVAVADGEGVREGVIKGSEVAMSEVSGLLQEVTIPRIRIRKQNSRIGNEDGILDPVIWRYQ